MSAQTGLRHIDTEEVPTKQCAKCKAFKPLSEFARRSKSKDGLQAYCRQCMRNIGHTWIKDHPFHYFWSMAKRRAKEYGREFSVTVEDITSLYRDTCPILGINLDWGSIGEQSKRVDETPTLDRIDNTRGYVKGNVIFLSWKANKLKSNGTLHAFKRIVALMEGTLA